MNTNTNKNERNNTTKIEFGYRCRDIITGYTGVVETRATFITGCDRVKLTVPDKDEENQKYFDVPTLKIVDKEVYEELKNVKCNKYDDLDKAKYSFGSHVKDKISGFNGFIVAKTISINGDISYCLTPEYDQDSKDNNGKWYDESRLDLIEKDKKTVTNDTTRVGGAVPSLKYY